MRILKRIIIENFQCHPKTVIMPSPEGLTVITGPTDHGKSAIVRAIKWLLYNRPQGTDFIRHGQTECKVTFEYTDGTTVQRRRTASLNQYYVNDDLFEGFGNTVPLEVQQATGVYNYEVQDQTLNLNVSEQLAGPFLGSSISAPLRAKILGKLAGTEDIDRANKTLGTDVYHAKQDKKKFEADIKEKDIKIKEYSWVEPLGKKLKRLETLQKQIQADNQRLELLKSKKNKLNEINADIYLQKKNIKQYETLPDVFEIIKNNEPDIKLLINFDKKNTELMRLAEWIREQKNNIQGCGQPEKALKHINKTNISVNQLENKEQKLQKVIGLHRKLVQADIEIGQNRTVIKSSGNPEEALKVINKCSNNIKQLSTLIKHDINYTTYDNQITKIMDELKKYQVINDAKTIINDTENQIDKLTDIQARKVSYDDRKKNITEYEKKIVSAIKLIKVYKDESIQAKEKYKQVLKESGICPYCGSEVEDECLDHVV